MEIRIRETGQVVYEGEFRSLHPNTSFPAQLTAQIINDAGADIVLEGPQASPTRYQTAYRDGVQQIDGQWFTKYSVADMDDETKAAKDAKAGKKETGKGLTAAQKKLPEGLRKAIEAKKKKK